VAMTQPVATADPVPGAGQVVESPFLEIPQPAATPAPAAATHQETPFVPESPFVSEYVGARRRCVPRCPLCSSSSRTCTTQVLGWLRRRFPRHPADVAGFTNDAPNPESVFIGVGIVADAFAYLVASKTLVPPLAIGLFGNWGSGKSFLMANVKHRVGQLYGGDPAPSEALRQHVPVPARHGAAAVP
jgi:hypothetical protein